MRSRMQDKQQRAETANKLLEVIASCGRRFFRYESAVATFEVDAQGRVWLNDEYSKRRIYTHYRYEWRGFTHGGTLRTLIEKLRDYIRTGDPQRLGLGPWPQWYCDGDLWGYGDAMQQVRDAAQSLGLIAERNAAPEVPNAQV